MLGSVNLKAELAKLLNSAEVATISFKFVQASLHSKNPHFRGAGADEKGLARTVFDFTTNECFRFFSQFLTLGEDIS